MTGGKNTLPAVQGPRSTALTAPKGGAALALIPQNIEEAARLAEILSKSEMVPKSYAGKPNDCLAAILMGGELGVSPIQSLQNIAVVNGRPSMWGDLVVGLVKASGLCEYIRQEWDPKTETATSRVKRKGQPERVDTFSMAQARRIKTFEHGKQITLAQKNTYQNYPERMCGWRCLTYGLRAEFADVLKGLWIREEAQDLAPDSIEATFSVFQTPLPPRATETPPADQLPASDAPPEDDQWAREFDAAPGPDAPQAPAEGDQQSLPAEDALYVVKAEKGGTGVGKNGRPYTWYDIELSDGRKPSTFSSTDFNNAEVAMRDRIPVKVKTKPGKQEGQLNLVSLEKA